MSKRIRKTMFLKAFLPGRVAERGLFPSLTVIEKSFRKEDLTRHVVCVAT